MGKKKQKVFKIYEYWTEDKVFSDLHIAKLFRKGWDTSIEALTGVKVAYNLTESDRAWRGTVEFGVPGEAIYIMAHDMTIYVSATVYQLREVLDQCGGCRNRKHKVKTIFSLDVEKEVDADRQQWVADKQAEATRREVAADELNKRYVELTDEAYSQNREVTMEELVVKGFTEPVEDEEELTVIRTKYLRHRLSTDAPPYNEGYCLADRIADVCLVYGISMLDIVKEFPWVAELVDDVAFPTSELDRLAKRLGVTFYWLNTGERDPNELKVGPCLGGGVSYE